MRWVAPIAVLTLGITPVLAQPPDLAEVRVRDFEVTLMDGTKVPLADLLPADRPAVVEFWATWCSPCRKTSPSLQKVFTRYGPEKLTVIGLSIEYAESSGEKVMRFVSEEGLTFPIGFAPPGLFQFMNQRDEVGVPKILVYDARGEVVEHITSYSLMTGRRIRKAARRVVAQD